MGSLEAVFKTKSSPNIVVLTGAGISAESGIKTFRDSNGLWENHSVEKVATPQGFAANPELVYRFYNQRRMQLISPDIQPNPAHFALAHLEQAAKGKVDIITQNVDNLHERAGSQKPIHMHGELMTAKCIDSGAQTQLNSMKPSEPPLITSASICPCCQQKGKLRPDIVWFGEVPYHMEEIERALFNADVFISVGTSGSVYPAAGFVQIANEVGAYTIEVNLVKSETHTAFDEHIYGSASETLPSLVTRILEYQSQR